MNAAWRLDQRSPPGGWVKIKHRWPRLALSPTRVIKISNSEKRTPRGTLRWGVPVWPRFPVSPASRMGAQRARSNQQLPLVAGLFRTIGRALEWRASTCRCECCDVLLLHMYLWTRDSSDCGIGGRRGLLPMRCGGRRSVGKGAYETSAVDVIAAMLCDGQLPLGNRPRCN
jgi:hypothetical protein